MPELLNKSESVLDLFEKDNNIDLYILNIPIYNSINNKFEYKYDISYIKNKYKNIIQAYNDNSFIDISEYDFDYVFFQRPYDNYLPQKLKSSYVVKYSICCYISYAYSVLDGFLSGYNKEFFDNVTYAFMESKDLVDKLKKVDNSKNKYLFLGYPVLSNINVDINNIDNDCILWTPRWTTSNNECHFFDYKNDLPKYIHMIHKKLVLRLHPLAYTNYIKQGLITSKEFELYIQNFNKLGFILDENYDISKMYQNASILISDISSIIVEFFLTGKPVIYCKSNSSFPDSLKEMSSLFYTANNFDDIKIYLKNIIEGKDYLLKKRLKFIEKFKKEHFMADHKIYSFLINN